jgi:23S rRNA (pseudouridine1915-N3)-methyltransferase
VRIKLFVFGKLKTPGLRDSADYYFRLLRPWASLDEIELKPCPVPDKSPATRTKIQKKETDLLLSQVETHGDLRAIFLLDEGGQSRTTLQWADWIKNLEALGQKSPLSFCIGSSLGFSPELRKLAKGTFSLGPQTLSHELARVVLTEQLYRALSVIQGHPYHNEGK